MRALVVEDNPGLARQMKEALEGAGYATDVAGDGEESHYLGDVVPQNVVIRSWAAEAGRGDGPSALARRQARMPVLILTARDRWSERVLGFDDDLTKLFHMEAALYSGTLSSGTSPSGGLAVLFFSFRRRILINLGRRGYNLNS